MFQREGKVIVRTDLPGLKREDIDVEVEDGSLAIHGRREEEKEVKQEDYYCCERASGEFSRSISLPEGVTPESIEAVCDNGVLEVSIPRPAAPEAKKITVQVK